MTKELKHELAQKLEMFLNDSYSVDSSNMSEEISEDFLNISQKSDEEIKEFINSLYFNSSL